MRRLSHGILAVCLALAALSLSGCGDDDPGAPTPPRTNEELAAYFQGLIDGAVSRDGSIRNAVMMVDAPLRGLRWKGAAGLADPAASLAMLADDQFRTASIGKMTCATLVMRLVEAGHFELGDSIHRYLPESVMSALHVFHGHDYSRDITVRHLLGHRSGLADYVEDGDENHNGMPDFLELLVAEPDSFWTPEETIEYTKEHLAPFFAPGAGFHYSDTNYQLLGLICESVTGKPLNELYLELLFAPLQMDHTYLEFYDTPRPSIPGRGLSHVYFDDMDYTDWASASADWAGGGLVSTTEDLSRFLRAFADDEIFSDPRSRTEMLSWGPTGVTGVSYGLGVARLDLAAAGLLGAGYIHGHEGFPQSFLFYWPEQEVTIAGTLNQAVSMEVSSAEILLSVIRELNR
jgi:D-alanyl-D-alanine carboxypeptidase